MVTIRLSNEEADLVTKVLYEYIDLICEGETPYGDNEADVLDDIIDNIKSNRNDEKS